MGAAASQSIPAGNSSKCARGSVCVQAALLLLLFVVVNTVVCGTFAAGIGPRFGLFGNYKAAKLRPVLHSEEVLVGHPSIDDKKYFPLKKAVNFLMHERDGSQTVSDALVDSWYLLFNGFYRSSRHTKPRTAQSIPI